MAEHRVRILHLSDLHERGPREGETWRRRRVLGEAWERNLDDIAEDGAVDLVCFTGNAAKPPPHHSYCSYCLERISTDFQRQPSEADATGRRLRIAQQQKWGFRSLA